MDGNGADNVVHFPGNWIGPLEDLVPFGPSAERAAGADPLRLAADPSAMTDSPALSADAFWGEDAGSIHAVVQPPRGGAVTAGSATGTATGPGEAGLVTAGRAAPAIATGAAAVQGADGPGAPARGSRRTFARHASLGGAFAIARRTPTRTQVVVLTALLALSGSMFALLGRRVAPQHSPGATLGETPAARSRANTGTRNGAAVLALSEIETGIEDQAGLEASASGAASVPSSAAAESAARAARHEPHRSAAARSDSGGVQHGEHRVQHRVQHGEHRVQHGEQRRQQPGGRQYSYPGRRGYRTGLQRGRTLPRADRVRRSVARSEQRDQRRQ